VEPPVLGKYMGYGVAGDQSRAIIQSKWLTVLEFIVWSSFKSRSVPPPLLLQVVYHQGLCHKPESFPRRTSASAYRMSGRRLRAVIPTLKGLDLSEEICLSAQDTTRHMPGVDHQGLRQIPSTSQKRRKGTHTVLSGPGRVPWSRSWQSGIDTAWTLHK
jgi:hypothetical protein